jgi:hypothetical protein
MFKQWPQPRLLFGAAAVFGLIGIGLLYAGLFKTAPVALLAAVLLCVLATIALTSHDIDRALRMEDHHDEQPTNE